MSWVTWAHLAESAAHRMSLYLVLHVRYNLRGLPISLKGLWHMGETDVALCARAATRQHEQAPCSVGIREVTLLRPPCEQAHECLASQTRWSQFSMDITVFPLSLFPGYERIHKVRVMPSVPGKVKYVCDKT